MTKTKVFVVGGAGAVGSLFCKLFLENNYQVTVLDLHNPGDKAISGVEYIAGDILNPACHDPLKEVDIIVLALPEEPVIECINILGSILSQGQCLVDTTSVKAEIVEQLEGLNAAFEILSINPMFGPSLGFLNQSVACIDINSGVLGQQLKDNIVAAGSVIVDMTAQEHDHYTAATQALTHAAIITFGMALQKMNYLPEKAKPIWTPPHKLLLALMARILGADPEVYRDIQAGNANAEKARQCLADSLADLNANVATEDPQQFVELFKTLEPVLGANKDDLLHTCQKLFEQV